MSAQDNISVTLSEQIKREERLRIERIRNINQQEYTKYFNDKMRSLSTTGREETRDHSSERHGNHSGHVSIYKCLGILTHCF